MYKTKKASKKILLKRVGFEFNSTSAPSSIDSERQPATGEQELMIGLLGAVGTDLEKVSKNLVSALASMNYKTHQLHLIDGVTEFQQWSKCPLEPLDLRIEALMTAGTEFRKACEANDALALLAVSQIREARKRITGDHSRPAPRMAYILRSLKTPKEVEKLREIYGKSFTLIAVSAPKEQREKRFALRIAKSKHLSQPKAEHISKAAALIERDEEEAEGLEYGQNLREAFPLADFFVDASATDAFLKKALERLVELMFGNFRHTSSRDEVGMLHAFAAGLRSASLARQVGAAICTAEGDVVATGCNDVPKAGGGLYWDGDDGDERDHVREEDSNDIIKRDLLADLLKRLRKDKWLNNKIAGLSEADLLSKALEKKSSIRKAQFMNISEYGRAVHAEMAAISDAAKRGVPVKGCVLYTTTFPCHNCAKHIVACGISRVVYVEPYPKSFAKILHGDALEVDSAKNANKRVTFDAFIGVSHRQCFQLFSMGNSDRKKDGKVIPWPPFSPLPKQSEDVLAYIQREETTTDAFNTIIKIKGLKLHEDVRKQLAQK